MKPARNAVTSDTHITAGVEFDAWHPGIRSPIPKAVQPLATMMRAENVFESFDEICELADFTGLPFRDLVTFRPERLAVHELLVRIAGDISVPEGEGSEDLGVNFREIAATIESHYLARKLPEITESYRCLRERLVNVVHEALSGLETARRHSRDAPSGGHSWGKRLRQCFSRATPAIESPPAPDPEQMLEQWRRQGVGKTEEAVVARVLSEIITAVRLRHGSFIAHRDLLAKLVVNRACNLLSAGSIGTLVDQAVSEAIDQEGYRRVPAQTRPVVMNTKGASAAGKSTMRPRQQALAARIGVDWQDFAVISPDIFRKYLLDYDSLGKDYKYAGMLTGEELNIIDRKLDRYMVEKEEKGQMPHLLIDRFRFDSFAPESKEPGSNLLTRFGAEVYMFFMVTPPHLTVERAWERGLRVGRYKTVDDLLYHNVEAYSGMPELFFTWAENIDKKVHYEFLDNGVPRGEAPRTIAFGRNGFLLILDVPGLLNIERYRKININANSAAAVYSDGGVLAVEENLDFLRACLRRLSKVSFASWDDGGVYLSVVEGRPHYLEVAKFNLERARSPQTATAISCLFPELSDATGYWPAGDETHSCYLPSDEHTLGSWAPLADTAH